MKVYLMQTDDYNDVVFAEGEQAKITESAPSGCFEGVDLYAADTIERLRQLLPTLELNDFDSMPGDEIPASELDNADIKLIFVGEYE